MAGVPSGVVALIALATTLGTIRVVSNALAKTNVPEGVAIPATFGSGLAAATAVVSLMDSLLFVYT